MPITAHMSNVYNMTCELFTHLFIFSSLVKWFTQVIHLITSLLTLVWLFLRVTLCVMDEKTHAGYNYAKL